LSTNYNNSDPRIAHTLSEYISAGNKSSIITYTKLCFLENNYVVKNIIDDYLYELTYNAVSIELTTDEFNKYKYKPKLLSSDVYGCTDLYYLILKLNNLYSVKQFNINPVLMLKTGDITDLLSTIYNAESAAITKFNSTYNS
jgi:hypothetical protein